MNATKSEVERELQNLEMNIRDVERRERLMGPYQGSNSPTTLPQSGGVVRERHQDVEETKRRGNWFGLAVNNLLGFKPKKEPFMKGDDVWTQMEEEAEIFIQRMWPTMRL